MTLNVPIAAHRSQLKGEATGKAKNGGTTDAFYRSEEPFILPPAEETNSG